MDHAAPAAPLLSARVSDALSFAVAAHGDQVRKGTTIPYVAHLLGVAAITLENGGDEDLAIAALLHDVVEDCDVTVDQVRDRFGPRIGAVVADCSDSFDAEKAPWRERKEAYLASLDRKPADSLLVSLSDKTHNARSICDDLAAVGPSLWERFTAGREGSLWYYRSLADTFNRLLPGPGARRLDAAVRQMELLAGDTL